MAARVKAPDRPATRQSGAGPLACGGASPAERNEKHELALLDATQAVIRMRTRLQLREIAAEPTGRRDGYQDAVAATLPDRTAAENKKESTRWSSTFGAAPAIRPITGTGTAGAFRPSAPTRRRSAPRRCSVRSATASIARADAITSLASGGVGAHLRPRHGWWRQELSLVPELPRLPAAESQPRDSAASGGLPLSGVQEARARSPMRGTLTCRVVADIAHSRD